jgi:secernin
MVLLLAVVLAIGAMTPSTQACDTWVALPDATRDGLTILAKNSGRVVFDSGPLMFYPRQEWPAGSEVNLGRIIIPQVEETYATLGSSPYWCWGYEEGVNEYGVAIGNQGVSTKVLADEIAAYAEGRGPKLGPTGMDLVRLGLERGKTAREALGVITKMVETYGQFGPGLPTLGLEGAYDNSYVIAGPDEAWVLDTAGTKWIAKRVSRGIASISNTLSIGVSSDAASSDIVEYAVAKGWWPKDSTEVFDFARAYTDEGGITRDRVQNAKTRAFRSSQLLREYLGQIDVRWMMRIARDRATSPGIDLDVTASSCVAVLPSTADDIPVFWWCPARPSNSCYVPFFVHGKGLPKIVSAAGTYGKRVTPPDEAEKDAFSPSSYWWLARDLCDRTNIKWDQRNALVRAQFDPLEKTFEAGLPEVIMKAVDLRKQGKTNEAATILGAYTQQCLDKVLQKMNQLREEFKRDPKTEDR